MRRPVNREYYVWLPAGYDPTRAYPLVFEGPGCGGKGTDVYPFTNCALPGNAHGSHDNVVNPGGVTYFTGFLKQPFTN